MQILTFYVNNICYGIPAGDVESIEARLSVIELPEAPDYVRGIVHHHGEVVPIYSLTQRFGFPKAQVLNTVVVSAEGMKVGLEIERVGEIVSVDDAQLLSMPPIMEGGNTCFDQVATRNHELIVLLDVNRLIPEEEREKLHELINKGKET